MSILFIYIFKRKNIFKIFFVKFEFVFNSDTEYRKLLSGAYEYEYEKYPDQDNFASNQPKDTTSTTTMTSLGSTRKTSTRSNIFPTIEKVSESTQTTHTTEMSTAESSKHYLR